MSDSLTRKQFLQASGLLFAGSTILPFAGCKSLSEPEPPTKNYISGAVDLRDVFSDKPITSGALTFPNGKTVPVSSDGLARFDSEQELRSGSYRVLLQPSAANTYSNHSTVVSLREDSASKMKVVPDDSGPFSYQNFLDVFCHGDGFDRVTERWPDNTTIKVYLYDESHVLEDIDAAEGKFVHSQDPNRVASPYFISDSIDTFGELEQMIPDEANIGFDIYIESEGKVEFPDSYNYREEDVMFYAGSPDAPYLLTQRYALDNSAIRMATLRQRTSGPDSAILQAPGAIRSDSLENMGIHTTGHGGDVAHVDFEGYWTPVVPQLLTAAYSFNPGTGLRKLDSSLPGKNGSFVSVVEHYEP